MNTTDLFFELLRVAVGTRTSLSVAPTAEQWEAIHALCKKQALVGVGFVGFSRLPKEQTEAAAIATRWYFQASKLQEKNARISAECREVCTAIERDGYTCRVLKGQSNLANYPEPLRNYRMPGDIDLWVLSDKGYRDVIDYVRRQCRQAGVAKMPRVRFHHIDMPTYKTDVEVHFRPSYFNYPPYRRRFEAWCRRHRDDVSTEPGFPIPGPTFNVVYQLVHIYRHLFNEGIGLRQVLDYYFVLETAHREQIPLDEANTILNKLGMGRFCAAIMWVMREVFAMPDEYMLCPPDEELGRFVLDEIMLSGNFGQGDERNEKMRTSSREKRFFLLTRRNMRFLRYFPTEVLFDPIRRIQAWSMNLK